jgi:hypothetical protein
MRSQNKTRRLLQSRTSPDGEVLWTIDFGQPGVATCAFCPGRASDVTAPHGASEACLVQLDRELRRTVRPINWVWFDPSRDLLCPAKQDTMESARWATLAMLLRRGVGVSLRTRGGVTTGAPLLMLAKRFRSKLRVVVELFAHDERVRQRWERGCPENAERIALAEQLQRAGADVAIGLGPLIPFVNDGERQLAMLLRSLPARGLRELVPRWIEDAPGLAKQVEHEVSASAARLLDGWFHMPGSYHGGKYRGLAPQVLARSLARVESVAKRLGLTVRIHPTPHHGQGHQINAPQGGKPIRQLDLFARSA